MKMEPLRRWKRTWPLPKTGTVGFEALQLLVPLLPSSITEDQQEEIYDIIHMPILRHVICENLLEGNNSDFSKRLLLKALPLFPINSRLITLGLLVTPVIKILNESIVSPKYETSIIEALNYLFHSISEQNKQYAGAKYGYVAPNERHILSENGFVILCNLYCHREIARPRTMDILLCLMSCSELEATSENQEAFNLLLAELSEQFNKDNTLLKFELCTQILTIILRCTSFSIQIETATKVRDTLTIILRNRIVNVHRHNAIKLASFLMDKFGDPPFLVGTEDAKKFFLVIIQRTCIEIQILLKDKSVSEVIGESFPLTTYYTVFDYSISLLITDGVYGVLDSKPFVPIPLLNSIEETMSVTLDFLKRAKSELPNIAFNSNDFNPTEQIVLCTMRVVCFWLAEETSALQEKVWSVLPFILNVCKEWFRHKDKIEIEISPMCFSMAALRHLAADNKCREILLNSGLLTLLFEHFKRTWIECINTQEDSVVEMLSTLCGIFITIIVLQPSLEGNSNDFFYLFRLLLHGLPIISLWSDHLVLKANFAVLGLLVTKHCHKRVKSCDTSFYPFLSASIKFLWDAHYVESQDGKLCLTRKYQAVWNDVMELWFLGIQELRSLLPIMPWIAIFIAESGWPIAVLNILGRVSRSGGIDGNIKSTYQALLSALVRSNDDVAETLVRAGGIPISKLHHLDELERLLEDCFDRRNLEFQ